MNDQLYKTFYIEGPPSLGVILYLYSRGKYIKSDFIARLNNKYKINNTEELIKRDLIVSIPTDCKGAFNNPPKYFSTNKDKLKELTLIDLEDEKLTKAIDSGLHLINGMKWNHWNNNYKNMELEIPEEFLIRPEIYSTSFTQEKYMEYFYNNIKPYWGGHKRNYFLPSQVAMDDNFGGRTYNFFCNNKKARRFAFTEPVEIDIAFCHPIMMGDLLLKNFGKNDFSNTMMSFYNPKDTNSPKDIYELIGNTREEGKDLWKNIIYDISYPSIFKDGFPDAYNFLHKIKMGEKYYFAKWAEDEFKTTDKRLTCKNTSKEEIRKFNRAKSMGQLHYKAISLKLQMKEVEIMIQIWSELKKEGILFIPIHDSIIIDRGEYKKVEKIMKGIWKENIDRRFKVIIKAENLLTNQLISKSFEWVNKKKI